MQGLLISVLGGTHCLTLSISLLHFPNYNIINCQYLLLSSEGQKLAKCLHTFLFNKRDSIIFLKNWKMLCITSILLFCTYFLWNIFSAVWWPFVRTVLLTQNHRFSLHNHIFMPHVIPTCGFLVINDVTMQILIKPHMYFVHLFPYGKHFNFPWPLCSCCMSFWLFLLLKSGQTPLFGPKISPAVSTLKSFGPERPNPHAI